MTPMHGIALAVFTGTALAQSVLTFHSDVDGSGQPYAVYLPKSLDPARKYPLLVSLHAEETNHEMNLRQVFGGVNRVGDVPAAAARPTAASDADLIVACPLARGTMGYQGIAERDVYGVLADVERRFPVDRDRVYLTGISMGGAGALWLALTHPDLWAAVAPVCPAGLPGIEPLTGNALNFPVRIYQGAQDPLVPVESSRLWQRRLLDLGVAADYIEYPGVRHNAWDMAYRGHELFDWLGQFTRKPYPGRVRLNAQSYRYASAYWLRIDSLTPGEMATVDARLEGNRLTVETSRADGFTVTPDRPLAAVTIDGAPLRVTAGGAYSFNRTSGAWRVGLAPPAGKRLGAEGPMAEAVAGRQIYVYGTGAVRGPEEIEARRKIAETAAAWSTTRTRLTLVLPVKADREVTAEDLDSSDLVLFGSAETNSLIARFDAQLPLALHAGAADYGLLFIASIGNHYVLVSSGLPWWTGAEEARRGGDPFAPAQYRLLGTFGDYILFRGSLADVVSEGRFDRNWKVPAEAARKMLATGTVTIH
jgi:pimeloyl-ACP methyl ester carboxylesterase